jgi:hypothetical protein
MTYTRPDTGFATKELARALTQPTTDQQELKHLPRCINETNNQDTNNRSNTWPDIQVFVDSDWAGWDPTTRKSMTGFLIKAFGATTHYGSRTQATIALSSAEAELYESTLEQQKHSLHISNFLKEALNMKKINIRVHTDSSSGKSMAIGSSKKAKHIELKHLFIQQLVAHDLVRITMISTTNNLANVFTKYVETETLLRHIGDVGINTHHY